jgi:hypothetical protein
MRPILYVRAAAPELIGRSSEVSQILAEYLGGIKSQSSRELLWQVAERPEPAHEQALIALTWIGDAQDLPRLSELLLKPADTVKHGRDLASLPYHLVRGLCRQSCSILRTGNFRIALHICADAIR